jgi:hypothetical protein
MTTSHCSSSDFFSEVKTSMTTADSASGGLALPRHTPIASWVLLATCCIFAGTYFNVVASQVVNQMLESFR